jgi:hypothetical protein
MKKAAILIILCLMFMSSFAQLKNITLGPKIGFNTSKIKTNIPGIKEDIKKGFMAGVFVRIGNKVYIQPELMFVSKGGILKNDDPQQPNEQKIKLSSIDIPVILGAKLINLKVVNIRFMIGPVASFIINKDFKMIEIKGEKIDEDNLKDAMWGLQFGAGIDVLMFALDFRYELGLNDFYKGDNGTDYNFKNDMFRISLGWKIL